MRKIIPFEQWIDAYGAERLAKYLKIRRETVWAWRARRCDPTVDHIRQIKHLTKGKVGYEQIIDRPTPRNSLMTKEA